MYGYTKSMNRSFSTDALVLSTRLIGEDNRIVTFLSPERGIFDAILYGGRKSKLRSLVSPFHSGKGWFYNDETRHSMKITDFDPVSFRPSLRENLYKTCAASFASELAVKTQGASDADENQRLWILINGFLDGLDMSSDEDAHLGTLRFIWRYLSFLGMQPDASECSVCGHSFLDADTVLLPKTADSMLEYYDEAGKCFLCHECAAGQAGLLPITQEGMHYLASLQTLTPSEVRKLPVHADTYQKLHDLLFSLVVSETGIHFRTLAAGEGIL